MPRPPAGFISMSAERPARRRPPPPRTLAEAQEEGFLRRLARRLPTRSEGVALGIGDDCAVLDPTGDARPVWTIDLMIEGTHFTAATMGSPRLLGRKALSVNISDLAAMGARPVAVLIGLALPPQVEMAWLDDLYRGFHDACRRYGCAIAGGDTTRGDAMHLSVTALGLAPGGETPALRSGARPGDTVYVSGRPGESAAGLALLLEAARGSEGKSAGAVGGPVGGAKILPAPWARKLVARHQDPVARVALGRCLVARPGTVSSMIDISDGLVHELHLLAEASGVGFEIEQRRLPLSPALRQAGRQAGVDPLRWVLQGGEDYELLFTSPLAPEALAEVIRAAGLREGARPIGRVTAGSSVALALADGTAVPCDHGGFAHF